MQVLFVLSWKDENGGLFVPVQREENPTPLYGNNREALCRERG
jgi:hypothetical protein